MNNKLYKNIMQGINRALLEVTDLFNDPMFDNNDSIETELNISNNLRNPFSKEELIKELDQYFPSHQKLGINKSDGVTLKFDRDHSFVFKFMEDGIRIRRSDATCSSNPQRLCHKNGEWYAFQSTHEAAVWFNEYIEKLRKKGRFK